MRIRKRQPLVLESTLPLFALNIPVEDSFLGQNSCTCCSRERQYLQTEFHDEVAYEDNASSSRYVVRESVTDDQGSRPETRTVADVRGEALLSRTEEYGKILTQDHRNCESQIVPEEEESKLRSMPLTHDVGIERARANEGDLNSRGGVAKKCSIGGSQSFERDVNHPANKPKESLLYSLYCVFSKLSGEAMLTAREALSRIIEHRLPGLDEGTGLPSVQVAKVMRSNPYFVHIEGGKFFLCSGPSTGDGGAMDAMFNSEDPTGSKPMAPFTDSNIAEVSAEDERITISNDVRGKRARSQGALNAEDRTSDKMDSRSRAPRKSFQTQTSVPHGTIDSTDMSVPICKRYDGRGWKCYEEALEGYSMCRHHHELIVNRLARLRNSGRLGSKKSVKRRKGGIKQHKEANATEAEPPVNSDQTQWWKNVKARSLRSINKSGHK